jgi:spermidine synthase
VAGRRAPPRGGPRGGARRGRRAARRRRRLRRDRAAFALGVAALLGAGEAGRRDREGDVLVRARSFFGAYTVRSSGTYHHLTHGTTLHGAQDTARPTDMLTYYHRAGPLGRMFAATPAASARRVAMVGLGTGTAACYGGQGDVWTFYEIDPLVARMASDPRLFTYLRDCAPRVEVVLGDARLRLAEAAAGAYDVILLDAFSSDAIPMHLLTREALALYLDKLAPGGIVAFHISNRYLDLKPPLAELARETRLAGAVGNDVSDIVLRNPMLARSTWVVLSRRAADLAELAREPGWAPLAPGGRDAPWTDDWSDVFSVVKWR